MNAIILALILSNGTYKCVKGNEPFICDQKIKVKEGGISVLYDGDCAGQGPYFYYCDENYCDDQLGVITFDIKDQTHYRWENKQYGFICDFERI